MDEFACASLKSTRYFIQMRLNKNVSTEGFTMNSEVQWTQFKERQVRNERETLLLFT